MTLFRFMAVGLLAVTAAWPAQAAWGASGCLPATGPVGPMTAYYWIPSPHRTDVDLLYRADGTQAGAYDYARDGYLPLLGNGTFGVACPSPAVPPRRALFQKQQPQKKISSAKTLGCVCKDECKCTWTDTCGADCFCAAKPQVSLPVEQPSLNFGLDFGRLNQPRRYLLRGREVNRAEAFQAVEGNLSDDSGKHRLVCVGAPEKCKQVRDDLAGNLLLSNFKDWLWYSYAPDHWHLETFRLDKDRRFQESGFALFLLEPGGKVCHAQYDYKDGAEGLHKAHPDYDPAKNPDRRKPNTPDTPNKPDAPAPVTVSPVWLLLGGAAFFLWFLTRKEPVSP